MAVAVLRLLLLAAQLVLQPGRVPLRVRLLLPTDLVVADGFSEDAAHRTIALTEIREAEMALDIGPKTAAAYAAAIEDAQTVLWNGPMGVFELTPFSRGTYSMVEALAGSQALTILGGGDTDVAVHASGNSDKIDHISTGGGAFLMLLEKGELPGINALDDL